MKSGILGAVTVLIVAAGWAAAQAPPAPPNAAPPAMPAASPTPLPGGAGNSIPPGPGTGNQSPPVLGTTTVPGMPQSGPANAMNNFGPNANAPAGPGCLSPDDVNGYGRGGCVLFASAEYLLWRVESGRIPQTTNVIPVGLLSVNTSNLFTANPASPGFQAGTPTVGFVPVAITNNATFDPNINTGDQNGARFTLGIWSDPDMNWGVEASFFFLDRGSDNFAAVAATSGNQFVLNTGFTQNLILVSGTTQTVLNTFPIIAIRETTASFSGNAYNTLLGGELNGRCVGMRYGCVDYGGLLGFRYLMFHDALFINDNVRLFRPAGFPITQGDASASLSSDLNFQTQDGIRTWNHFFGAQAGLDCDAKFGPFFVYLRGTVAVGTMYQVADVASQTNVINNDPTSVQPPSRLVQGGLLAGPLDVGRHTRTRLSVIPAGQLKVGYQVCTWLRAFVGYDGMNLNNVARAGNASTLNTLSTNVQIAGSANTFNVQAPTFRFRDQDVWVNGLSFGLEAKW
jgi:hypothetical protein